MSNSRRSEYSPWIWLLAAGLIASYFSYALTVTPLVSWGDGAHYLHHAEHLATGQSYSDTGYVVNRYAARISPESYPPGYPALLAVGYKLFDGDVLRIKQFAVLAWIAFLLLFYRLGRVVLTAPAATAVTLLLAINPMFWRWHDLLVSEILFLLFVTASLGLHEAAAYQRGRSQAVAYQQSRLGTELLFGVALGLAVTAAYATRSLAVVLLPALLVTDIWRYWRVKWATVLALAIAVPAIWLQEQWLGAIGNYGEIFDGAAPQPDLLAQIISRFRAITWGFMSFFGQSLSSAVAVLLSLLLVAFAVLGGLWLLWQKKLVTAVVYCGGTLALLLILPFGQDARRMSGMLPFLLLFAAVGWQILPLGKLASRALAGILLTLCLTTAAYDIVDASAENAAYAAAERQRLRLAEPAFDYVRSLPEGSRLMFRYPRTLAFTTGKPATGFYENTTTTQLLEIIREHQIGYWLEDRLDASSQPLRTLGADGRISAVEAWRNERFSVVKINRVAPAVTEPAQP